MELNQIVQQYLGIGDYQSTEIVSGLINTTLLIEKNEEKYILQKINHGVFLDPEALVNNHLQINLVLQNANYDREIIDIIPTIEGVLLLKDAKNQYWRMTSYVENAKTYLKVPNKEIALEAAICLSEFYRIINEKQLLIQDPLPGFINFKKRTDDFVSALESASEDRKQKASEEIDIIKNQIELPEKWLQLLDEEKLPKRIIHADPKISNILFSADEKATAVIDLDTIMEDSILYDFGDMVRSYCNKTDEDDASLKENFDGEIYKVIKQGFLSKLEDFLTDSEKGNLDYAAQVVIYIQAVRFLTDYLKNDSYYHTDYPDHNLDRTKNQLCLLKNLQDFHRMTPI